ncbi:MAG: dihydrofolate reductase [Flavobacteriaceae bacterium]|nr:dihydrofolate reductase [Flavobacteriaceae bacterium]
MRILIAATSQNNAIGKDNKIIWHLPDDFKHFKELTSGHHIIMGRKTFESFPKPLPNRTHVVISRQKNYNPEGCIVVNSIEEALKICPVNEDVFLIGGAEIYKLGLPFIDKIELTFINETFEADAFFPEINFSEWKLTNEEFHTKDEKHAHEFSFQTYIRL